MLDRLDRLEAENKRLSDEIASLRNDLAETRRTAEQVDVQAARTAELEQKKVEASQKMPVQLTGNAALQRLQQRRLFGHLASDPVVANPPRPAKPTAPPSARPCWACDSSVPNSPGAARLPAPCTWTSSPEPPTGKQLFRLGLPRSISDGRAPRSPLARINRSSRPASPPRSRRSESRL